MKEPELVSYSVYSGEIDTDVCPIRVDSGEFSGTIFLFDNVKADEDSLNFSLEFMRIVHNGVDSKKFPSKDLLLMFHESVAKAVLVDLLTERGKV